MTTLETFQRKEQPHFDHWNGKLYDWSVFTAFTEAVAKVDFGCNWQDGTCAGMHTRGGWMNASAACCTGCAHEHGYLHNIRPGSAEQYASMYNEETGFWRKGQGCILPRDMRSYICNRFTCGASKQAGVAGNALVNIEYNLFVKARTANA